MLIDLLVAMRPGWRLALLFALLFLCMYLVHVGLSIVAGAEFFPTLPNGDARP